MSDLGLRRRYFAEEVQACANVQTRSLVEALAVIPRESGGRVLALEVEETTFEWVEVRHSDGTGPLDETLDAIFVHAGVTHPLDAWLDALGVGGRHVLPITASRPAMGPISKGMVFLIMKGAAELFDARPLTLLAISTAIGLRDETLNSAIGMALKKGPFAPAQRLRRDSHERGPACWLHGPTFCLAM